MHKTFLHNLIHLSRVALYENCNMLYDICYLARIIQLEEQNKYMAFL